jgi:hypothetical protein
VSIWTASLLLLVTVLAQISYLDHVVAEYLPASQSHGHSTHDHGNDDQQAATSSHALHCHEGLAGCSDLPLAAGPGQILLSEELLVGATMATLLFAVLRGDSRLTGLAIRPVLQPPRLSIA